MILYTARRALTQDDVGDIEDGAAVLVHDGVIEWVGRAADFPSADYAHDLERIDLGAATLLPGLIDAHVHLAFDGGPAPVERMMAESDPQQVALMLRSARELLSVGVTTARDLGARSYLDVVVRDAIADGTARGPRILTSGSPITVTGGHCWFMGGEADGELEVRKLVRRHHRAGVDGIKVMSTGGFMTAGSAPWYAQYDELVLRAAVEEAHRVGKKVAAHAHGVEGIDRAVRAGVDTLEHCSFVHPDGSHAVVPELADRIAASDSYVSPTLNFRVAEYIERSGGIYRPPLMDLVARGAKIIVSTDSGIDEVPHYGYVGALEVMNGLGMPARDVLASATSIAADALGIAHITGRLRPGLAADILAVEADLDTSLTALRQPILILARGEEFTPDRFAPLRAMFSDGAASAAAHPGHAHEESR
ncbi:imidazolonepropionase-like amidohydrolase [Microbacterium sp. AG790]|nr:imidazolonepropionase-like amidohydrolase [Microbacterium sp. AG790]